ncbi:MAG: DUF5656 family protein [Dehalococcoidia bacterium]
MTESRVRRGFGSPLGRLAPVSPLVATVALTAAFAVLLALYLATELVLFLLLLVVLVVAGTDRLLRLHPQGRFHGPTATVLYLFLPGLFALTTALALGQSDNTFVQVALGVVTVLLFAVTEIAEYLTVDPNAETYELARFGLLVAIYWTAVFTFVATFTAGLALSVGILLVAGTIFLLTVDMLRELEPETTALWVQAGVVAVVMAECRWVLYYLSLGDVLAGAFMLIVYYVMTLLVQDRIAGRVEGRSWITYGLLGVTGSLVILVARIFVD